MDVLPGILTAATPARCEHAINSFPNTVDTFFLSLCAAGKEYADKGDRAGRKASQCKQRKAIHCSPEHLFTPEGGLQADVNHRELRSRALDHIHHP